MVYQKNTFFILRNLRLWFNYEDFKNATVLDKVLNMALMVLQVIFYGSAILYQLMHRKECEIDVFVHKIGFLVTFLFVSLLSVTCNYQNFTFYGENAKPNTFRVLFPSRIFGGHRLC